MTQQLVAYIYRRGRGEIKWRFNYVDDRTVYHFGFQSWYTTPGWYCKKRKYVYRITLDHDYPNKPIWLGRKNGKVWENMEELYEPLYVKLRDYTVYNVHLRGKTKRKIRSRGVIGFKVKEDIRALATY